MKVSVHQNTLNFSNTPIQHVLSNKFPETLRITNRPLSILPIISKIFKKLMCKQLLNHFDNIFSKSECGFRKGFRTQHCLLLIIDKWKKAVDSNKAFGGILTDLSEAFDCICHDLLVAKLHVHGLSLPALKMIQDYLLNWKQRTKIGSSYSTWENIISGVPQGSIFQHVFMGLIFGTWKLLLC